MFYGDFDETLRVIKYISLGKIWEAYRQPWQLQGCRPQRP